MAKQLVIVESDVFKATFNMKYQVFENPYDAVVDRVSRCLGSKTLVKFVTGEYRIDFQKQPPDVFISACILVLLHRMLDTAVINRVALLSVLTILCDTMKLPIGSDSCLRD